MDTAILILLPAVASATTIAAFLIAQYARATNRGKDDGKAAADIRYVREGIDDIKLDLKEMNQSLSSHTERITRVEESAKQAHKRIDKIA